MTICNYCGVEVRGPRTFLCKKCAPRCPDHLMTAYDRACNALERFKREEWEYVVRQGGSPDPDMKFTLVTNLSGAYVACREAIGRHTWS